MHEVCVTESKPITLGLSSEDASTLRRLGVQMASNMTWWRSGQQDGSEENERSVIKVETLGDGRCRVLFLNVVGTVRLSGVQLQILPKIPLPHFLYLIDRGSIVPRSASASVNVGEATNLVEVLARWCIAASEELLRRGLRTDYRNFTSEQREVRGQVMLCDTALEMLRGRPIAVCAYEELSEDAPMNRVVRGACQRLARCDMLKMETRARALAVAHRMDGVGPIQPADMRVPVDRVSKAYGVVLPLARLVLQCMGVSIELGTHAGTAFLLRTPELVEDGLRAIVTEALPALSVAKVRKVLGESGISMNPDLVFGDGRAVGDCKYRFFAPDWSRSELYQSIAFATAFRCNDALIIGFTRDTKERLPPRVQTGDVRSTPLAWLASPLAIPEDSARGLRDSLARWAAESHVF
jgi:5-methylcytosine-specific restriction enzyme subunit McrC